jgi:hypothetical protein
VCQIWGGWLFKLPRPLELVSKPERRLFKLPPPSGGGRLKRGFSQNNKGKVPMGFSRKG